MVLGAIALAVASFAAGVKWEGDARDAAQLQAERAARAERDRLADVGRRAAIGVAEMLNDERDARERERVEFERRLGETTGALVRCRARPAAPAGSAAAGKPPAGGFPPFTPDARPAADPTPAADLAAPVFTGEFAGLWNRALGAGVPPADDPRRAAAPAGGTRAADPEEGVLVQDLLRNLQENGERWAECRAQVRGWQALAGKNGWVSR